MTITTILIGTGAPSLKAPSKVEGIVGQPISITFIYDPDNTVTIKRSIQSVLVTTGNNQPPIATGTATTFNGAVDGHQFMGRLTASKSGNNYTVNIRNLTLDDNGVIEGAALYLEDVVGGTSGYFVAKTEVNIVVKGK